MVSGIKSKQRDPMFGDFCDVFVKQLECPHAESDQQDRLQELENSYDPQYPVVRRSNARHPGLILVGCSLDPLRYTAEIGDRGAHY